MSDLFEDIKAAAEELAAELTRLRRDFHQHPELSHEERRTAMVSAAYLADLGLEVQEGIAGQGVAATLQGARPGGVVAFRADMDALPIGEKVDVPWRCRVEGVMHACGHDFHLSLALGAARLLASCKDRLAGNYRFIFQPAEEGPPGGRYRRQGHGGRRGPGPPRGGRGLRPACGPQSGCGPHPLRPGVVMAGADRMILTVTGKSAHGATPHRGVDPILVRPRRSTQIQGFLAQQIDARSPRSSPSAESRAATASTSWPTK